MACHRGLDKQHRPISVLPAADWGNPGLHGGSNPAPASEETDGPDRWCHASWCNLFSRRVIRTTAGKLRKNRFRPLRAAKSGALCCLWVKGPFGPAGVWGTPRFRFGFGFVSYRGGTETEMKLPRWSPPACNQRTCLSKELGKALGEPLCAAHGGGDLPKPPAGLAVMADCSNPRMTTWRVSAIAWGNKGGPSAGLPMAAAPGARPLCGTLALFLGLALLAPIGLHHLLLGPGAAARESGA
jgi:hypothetical protein